MGNIKRINEYGRAYSAVPFEPEQSEFRRRFTAARLRERPHARVLEIGCGLSSLSSELDDFEHWTIIEPFADFAAKARKRAGKNHRIHVIDGFLEDHVMSLQKERFDVIVASGVLNEVADPKSFMADIASAASRNSIIYVSAPNAGSFHRLLAVEMKLIPDIYADSKIQKKLRQRLYDMESLRRAATNAGFRVIDSGYYAFKPFTHAQMEKLMQQRFLNKRMLDGLFNMCKHAPELGSEMFVELKLSPRPRSSNKK